MTATQEKRKYAKWFFSDSLGADYGSFVCDICHSTFYHSPAEIHQGETKLHNCVCGICTNTIIFQDHNTTVYF